MSTPAEVDFLISFNKADKRWAEWVAWILEEAGYTVVYQGWDFTTGSNFVLEMHKAAQRAERTVAILSPHYLKSPFTAPEWAAAFAQDPKGDKRKLVPFRVEDCKPDGLLGQIVYTDLVGLSEDDAQRTILEAIVEGRHKAARRPNFPGAATKAPTFPGHPPVWNVPHIRNPNFVGREDVLSKVAARGPIVLAGVGGAGKTQIAAEHAHRASARLVWWLRCDDDATLLADFVELGRRLGIVTGAAGEAPVDAVRKWLNAHEDWILVFDAAREPAQVAQYLPAHWGGAAIITTQNPNWGELIQPLDVHTLDRSESVRLLCSRAGRADDKSAEKVAELLGDLPLALEHAAGYVESTGRDYAWYAERYSEVYARMFKDAPAPVGHPASILTTWELAAEGVREVCPEALDLLRLLSFVSPTAIDERVLFSSPKTLATALQGAANDALVLERMRASLRRFSLVRTAVDGLVVHRVVQDVTRFNTPEIDRKPIVASLVDAILEALPEGVSSRDEEAAWDALLPHALAALDHAAREGDARGETCGLHNHVGSYLMTVGDAKNAVPHFANAAKLARVVYGPYSAAVSTALSNQGTALREAGDPKAAEEPLLAAVSIDRGAPSSPMKAANLNAYGVALRHAGKFMEAEIFLMAAIEIDQEIGDKASFARDLHNLSLVHRDQGKFDQAARESKRAAEMNTELNVDDESVQLRAQSNAGDLQYARGNYEEALKMHMAALARARKGGRAEATLLSVLLNNAAVDLTALKRYKEAEGFLREAIELDTKMRGEDHPDIARDWGNLANALRPQGDLKGALEAMEKALDIQESKQGKEHPIVGTTLNNMSGILKDMGRDQDAMRAIERAVAIAKKTQPPHEYARVLTNKAILQYETGDLHGAIETATQALDLSTKSLGSEATQSQQLANLVFQLLNERSRRFPPPRR